MIYVRKVLKYTLYTDYQMMSTCTEPLVNHQTNTTEEGSSQLPKCLANHMPWANNFSENYHAKNAMANAS